MAASRDDFPRSAYTELNRLATNLIASHPKFVEEETKRAEEEKRAEKEKKLAEEVFDNPGQFRQFRQTESIPSAIVNAVGAINYIQHPTKPELAKGWDMDMARDSFEKLKKILPKTEKGILDDIDKILEKMPKPSVKKGSRPDLFGDAVENLNVATRSGAGPGPSIESDIRRGPGGRGKR